MINEIVEWQKERLLDKQNYDYSNEFVNIFEEMLESIGIKVTKDVRPFVKERLIEFIFKLEKDLKLNKEKPTQEDKVDAYFDICVFAIGAMLKLGYEPECVFREGINEISTRVGSIVDGKFQKDTSEEAKKNWYKANFKKCKRS